MPPSNKITALKGGEDEGSDEKEASKKDKHKLKGHSVKLDLNYDAYYCIDCVEWLEKKCIQESCQFCPNRPEKPEIP